MKSVFLAGLIGSSLLFGFLEIPEARAALPTVVNVGTCAKGAGAVTPTLPAGIATDDILLIFLSTEAQAISIATPNGGTWTEVLNSPQSVGTAAGADGARLTVFWSRYNGTQGDPTTSDSGDVNIGCIIAVNGVTTTGDPWDVTAGGTEAGNNDTSGAIPGATTGVADTLVVAGIATALPDANNTAAFSGWTNTDLANVLERVDEATNVASGGGLGFATGEKATAGAYGATSVTVSVNAAKAMMSIALKPPPPPPPANITVSGNAYENDSGTTALVACDGTTSNIKLIVATSTAGQYSTNCADATGAWSIDTGSATAPAASTTFVAYIDGSPQTFGSTVHLYRGSGNTGGLTIRASTTILDYDSADGPIQTQDLDKWDNDNDTDLPYVVTTGQGLTFEQNVKWLIGTSTAAANAVTFVASSTASTTPGGTFARGGDVAITSGSTLNMGANNLTVGGDLMNFGTLTLGIGQLTAFNGSRSGGNSFNAGENFTFQKLTISGSVPITASSSIKIPDTLTINTGSTMTIPSGKNATTTTSTVTLNGTIDGTGTTTFGDGILSPCTNIPSTGTLSSNIRADGTGPCTLPARVYGANLEVIDQTIATPVINFASGSTTVVGALLLAANSTGNLTLNGAANNPTMNITGNLDYTGGGAGNEILWTGTGTWTTSGNVDFTGGTFAASSTNTFVMNGSSKTLTSASQSFANLTLSGSITLADNITASGNVTLSGTVTGTGRTLTMNGTGKTLVGGGNTLRGFYQSAGDTTLGTSDITIGTTTVASGATLTIGAGRIYTATSTFTLAGTVGGTGTTTFGNASFACTNVPTGGTLSSNVRIDADVGNCTMPARTYGNNVEVTNNDSFARTVTMAAGTHTISGSLIVTDGPSALGTTLNAATNNPTVNITNDLILTGNGGSPILWTGTGTWTVSGNVAFTNGTFTAFTASSTNTFTMDGTSKTLTSASQSFANLTLSGTITLADNVTASGNVTLSGTVTGTGRTLTMNGTGKTLQGGGNTLRGLYISAGDTTLGTSDITIGTTTVASGVTLTVGAGRIYTATSTFTLTGTLGGTGTTSFGNASFACTNVPSGGTLSSNVRLDATVGDCTMPNRTYGANVEAFSNSSAAARTVTMAAGTHTISSALLLNAANTQNVTLASDTNNPTVNVTGDLDFVGAGAGAETVALGSGTWTVSGNVDFTGGTITLGPSGNTFVMDGTSKTLTSGGQTLNSFTVSGGSISLADNLTLSGNLTKSGGTFSDNGRLITLLGTAGTNIDLSGGAQTLHNLRISASYSLINGDLTVSTSTIDSGFTLTVNSPRILTSTSTMTLNGIIAGTGTTTFGNASFACSGVPSGGTLSTNVRADATAGDCTIAARVYGKNLEIFSNSSAAGRTVNLTAASTTVVSTLWLNAANTQNVTLAGTAAAMNVTGDLDYIGTGSGSELITSGAGTWTVSGNVDFTGGTYTATSGNTLTMNGASKTITPAGNNLYNFTSGGSITISGNATTTNNLTINTSSSVTAPGSSNTLYIGSNYTNNGTFTHNSGKVILNGSAQQTLSGTMIGGSAFSALEITNSSGGGDATSTPSVIFANVASTTGTFTAVTANTTFRLPAAATSTFQNINWNGQAAGTRVKPRSATSGTRFAVRVPGTRTVSNVDFMDADFCDEAPDLDATDGTNANSGNNGCILFAAAGATIVSAANQVFEVGQGITAISQITATGGTGSGAITATNDLRIAIATSTVDMRWDTADTTAVFGGTASTTRVGSATVSYEGGGSVLLIGVDSNFANGETLTVSGLNFKDFNTVVASSTALQLFLDGPSDQSANANNTAQYVAIKGKEALAGHNSVGQEVNKLNTAGTVTNAELLNFRLTPSSESVNVTQLVISLSNLKGYACGDLTNMGVYVDFNSSGDVDAGDPALGGTPPACSITGSSGSLTLSPALATSTARNYILRMDVANNDPEDKMVLSLTTSNITASGVTSLQSITPTGSVGNSQHFRESAKTGGEGTEPGGGGGGGTGGGTGTGGGGGTEPPPGGGGGTGGGGGAGGGGGTLEYVPSLTKPLASIIEGLQRLVELLKRGE